VTAQFFAVEVDAFKPGSVTVTIDEGHGVRPHGTMAMFPDPVPDSGTIRASDLGYRTLASDAVGLQVYPPFLSEAFNINRRMNLDPVQPSVAAAWGSIQLVNQDGQYDAISASWNSDGRDVRVLTGSKVWDTVRRVYVDPPYAALSQAFVGVATPWFLSDTTLSIPLRDATYWIERPIQPTQYLGTGGLEGPTLVNGGTLTGAPKPKARGGTAANPIRNVSPVLVDTVNRIYQYNDAPGQVINLYEGGALTITRASDTTNLYAGSTPAGQYRTDNSHGLFQLGSVPVAQITADIVGNFAVAGAKSIAADVARYMLTEDLSLPIANLDVASFTNAASAYPYVAGVYFGPNDSPDGATAVARVVGAFGAALVPTRTGALRLMVLRALTAADFSPPPPPVGQTVGGTLTDSLAAADTAAAGIGRPAAVADNLTASEAVNAGTGPAAAIETLAASEAVNVRLSAPAISADNLTASDTSNAGGAPAAATETLAAADAVAAVKLSSPSLAETLAGADTENAALSGPVAAADSLAASDTRSIASGGPVSAPETLTASDALAAGLSRPATIGDSLTAADAMSVVSARPASIAETLTASDTESLVSVRQASLAETLAAADTESVVNKRLASVTETLTATDRLPVWVKIASPITDLAGATPLTPINASADPSVLWDGSQYRMYFTGAENSTGRTGIGYATSTDGSKWSLYKKAVNPDPWVDLVLGPASSTDWNGAGLETASIMVGPDSVYRLYYTGDNAAGTFAIGQATSTDGIAWTDHGSPVLSPVNAWEGTGVLEPSVIYDASVSLYKMWYVGMGTPSGSFAAPRVGYATSPDGLTWTRNATQVFDLGASGSWDEVSVSHVNVVKNPFGTYEMFYFGERLSDYTDGIAMQRGNIGHATSANGTTWTRDPNNPILKYNTTAGQWDSWMVGGPTAVYVGTQLKLWYFGTPDNTGNVSAIGYAAWQ
jgi:predicted GH43/DUF377 family glycosyl hydrolase